MQRLITVKETSDITGVPIATLRCWLRNNRCPFKFRKTLSGRLFTTLDEITLGFQNLPTYQAKQELSNNANNANSQN